MGTFRFPVLLVALALCGCAGQAQWSPSTSRQEVEASVPKVANRSTQVARSTAGESEDPYKLDAGDRVRVAVAGDDALSGSYEVSTSGAIDMPAVGAIAARGLNAGQLSAAIARQLKQHNGRDAHVAVQVETYRPFTIRGEVANPGQYPYVNNMTAETAIAIAGGLKPGVDKGAVIVSSAPGGAASLDTPVRPGDTVTVTAER
jgi:polysaccharide export outer membrane protein